MPEGKEVFEELGAEGVGDGVAEGGWKGAEDVGKNEGPEDDGCQEDVSKNERAVGFLLFGSGAVDDGCGGANNQDDAVDCVDDIGADIADYHGETNPDEAGVECDEKNSFCPFGGDQFKTAELSQFADQKEESGESSKRNEN